MPSKASPSQRPTTRKKTSVMNLVWILCAVATWFFTRDPALFPYALISAFLCGACVGIAACEKEIKKAQRSERAAWRYFDKMEPKPEDPAKPPEGT